MKRAGASKRLRLRVCLRLRRVLAFCQSGNQKSKAQQDLFAAGLAGQLSYIPDRLNSHKAMSPAPAVAPPVTDALRAMIRRPHSTVQLYDYSGLNLFELKEEESTIVGRAGAAHGRAPALLSCALPCTSCSSAMDGQDCQFHYREGFPGLTQGRQTPF